MVDVSAGSNFDLGSGPSSSQQSGASSPLHVGVPPTINANEFFSPTVTGTGHLETDVGAGPSSERKFSGLSDSDIYRGERPPSPIPRPLDADGASVASSSSSSSLNVGRRFGALANAVEAAIARWARAHSSASSTSSSSSSSISTAAHTYSTRRPKGRRYSSTASVHNAAHERAFLARKKAQEEFRVVPREFTLLLPQDTVPAQAHPSEISSEQAYDRRTIRTTSLPLILHQLDSALKKSAKSRRAQERHTPFEASPTRSANKGKGKKAPTNLATAITKTVASTSKSAGGKMSPKAWWLDIASPSWEDLRSLGNLLHLHPLTLEDILHRDPREKLEVFPGLGYYFIVFRALEGERSRERFRRFRVQTVDGMASLPSSAADEGAVGAVNVYIVVFSEGICSFHSEDISEHTERLRNRLLQMEQTFDMTSDWIAHGLMDSIVDSFFPILMSIEKEVKEVDTLALERPSRSNVPSISISEAISVRPRDGGNLAESTNEKDTSMPPNTVVDEKIVYEKEPSFFPWRLRVSISYFALMRHIRNVVQNILRKRRAKEDVDEARSSTFNMLLRMAAIRRIVTSLGRLLGTKGEVVAQIRKRLTLASVEASNKSLALDTPSDGEVAIYLGDIQDHIVTLQQSLNHYERMLSHSYPAYVSQLRVSQSLARAGHDKAILFLSVVSITVVTIQVLFGVFSQNVQVPNNKNSHTHPFLLFYAILGVCVFIACTVVCLVRYWYVQAKKKYSRRSL